MSAAEPVRTRPHNGGADHDHAAPVLPFRRPIRGRSSAVPQPPSHHTHLTAQEKLAATVEAAFGQHGRTLTDPATAEALAISLGLMRTVLAGALAQGMIDQPAHDDLSGVLDGMQAAPGVLG